MDRERTGIYIRSRYVFYLSACVPMWSFFQPKLKSTIFNKICRTGK